jgi:hypothetical protein
VWGKPGGGGALASWFIGPLVVHLAPTGCTSYSVANLTIQTPTRTLCVLHQSTWFSAQHFTFAKWVRCMCTVLTTSLAIQIPTRTLCALHQNTWLFAQPLTLAKWVGCRNPTLAKCGGEAEHLEKVRIWSPPGLPNVQSSTARPKTPCIEVFLVSLERS